MLKNRVFVVMADRGIRTQRELAERMGLGVSNVHNIVNDNFKAIRRDTLEKLCEVLECQPGDLLEYVPSTVPAELVSDAEFEEIMKHKEKKGSGRVKSK